MGHGPVETGSSSRSSLSLFEFGGSEESVRELQRRYLRYFRDCSPVLDIGCGRGIFLGMLQEAGIEASGVDHSEESIAVCREKGFGVVREDARAFLARNEAHYGGILCSHVIEHLGYDDAMEMLRLCRRALRPGGVLIVVTPNPEDLAIISEIFWLDPTHVRPYPKLLLARMLESVGFEVTHQEQFLGGVRQIGRRNLPMYFVRRLLLGRYYGRPVTMLVARNAATKV